MQLQAQVNGQNELEFQGRDNGPGIAVELLPSLFEPFVSGKETGLGLGLVVSRRIAEAHGGTLIGANLPTGGASFLLRLPTVVQPAASVSFVETTLASR